MLNELKCKICGYEASTRQGFNNHLKRHHIKSKKYYDEYLKKEGEGMCHCGNPTKFRDMWYGYNKHCCKRCIPLDPEIQDRMKATCQENMAQITLGRLNKQKLKLNKLLENTME